MEPGKTPGEKAAVRSETEEAVLAVSPEPAAAPAQDETGKAAADANGRDDQPAEDLDDTGIQVVARLQDIKASLSRLCTDTDPLFIRIARELRQVSSETKMLAGSMLETTQLVSDEKNESGILDRTGDLVQRILDSLTGGSSSIESSMQRVRELVDRILSFYSIIEQVDTISSRLRVVRINIRIQCSTKLISEDMFKSMTDDINSLSRKLSAITAQVRKDLSVAVRKLTDLEQSVAANLQQFATVSSEAREVITRAFRDIDQLMSGVIIMIEEAGKRSKVISEKVDDVVVSIQFHDSLNQRVEHIQQAFDDVCGLLGTADEHTEPEQLGTAWRIIDLQHRQLGQIVHEVGKVKRRIQNAFRIMEQEVSGLNAIDCDSRLEAVGPQQFLSSLFVSLQDELMKLCGLLSSSSGILEQMRMSAVETKSVAENLQDMMNDIQEMREDTRLNAANTIIMASNLGKQGSTIHVLAREISALSKQTGEVTDSAEFIHSDIDRKVAGLLQASSGNNVAIKAGEVEDVTLKIRRECGEVEQRITEVSNGIKDAGRHIQEVNTALSFLEELQDRLKKGMGHIEIVKDLLGPWKDSAGSTGVDVDQLVERYTMELERAVHSFRLTDEQQAEQSDDDIFF